MNQRLKILVVDDHVESQKMFGLILAPTGHQVLFAMNGQEAVELIQSQQPDLVFMDIQMPIMTGWDATKKIRELEKDKKHTLIVAVTAGFAHDENISIQAGMDMVITKPFDVKQIHEVINACIDKRPIQNLKSEKKISRFPSTIPVLDVQAAINRFSGDKDNYLSMLNEFESSLKERLQEISRDAKNENWQGLSNRAHNLKGLSASLGAMKLANSAMELEKQVDSGRYENVAELVKNIGNEIHILSLKISVYLQNPN